MKKIYMILAAITLLSLSLNAQDLKVDQFGNVVQPKAKTEKGNMKAPNRATITGSVTAADGTSTSTGYQWLPVYGYYFESAQTIQMIYTATQLNGLQAGDKITSLTFYPRTQNGGVGTIGFSGGSITLSLGNTSISQFSSNSALSVSTTQVARVTNYPVSNGAWTITFTTPFTYTGENILVQVNTTSGNYGRTYFYGQDQTNYQSRNSYGSTNRYYFLPKIKLDYERSDDPEISASPTSVSLSSIPGATSTQTVTVSGLNLTTGITATISGTDASLFSVSPSSLGTSGGSLTVTYSPTAVGTHTATLTLSSTGAQDVTITLNGECTQDLTICNGTNTSSNLPVYGLYVDNYQINQMIYPEITSLIGKKLTSMTFYANSEIGAKLASGTWTIKLGTTTATDFGTSTTIGNITSIAPADIQEVVTGYHFTTGANTLTIVFDTPFDYNGGNLLIEFDETAYTSDWVSVTFYGLDQSNVTGFYSNSESTSTTNGHLSGGAGVRFLPKVTFTFEETGPKIVVSPETLTINDSGTNNTFTVQGSNLGTDNVGVTVPDGSGFTRTTDDQYWGFVNNNGSVSGTATIGYEGRDLSASTTVSVGNNLTSATVAVTYRADLYIVGNFGNGWDFSTGTQMNYNSDNNTYTATITVDADNLILFARKLGESNPWNTRLVFGPNSDGDWWVTGDNANGTIDLYDDDPIKFVNGDTYTVTINATTGALTIEKQVLPPPENVVAVADSENQSATVTWDAPSNLPTGIAPYTEGFDDTSKFEPFSLGGITADNHIGENGGWTLYDPTGARVWGVDGGSFTNMSEPHAWFVMNPSQATGVDITPKSPEQYMESICPLNNSSYTGGAADHWLISPELSGNAQTITFYERIITTGYEPGYETYEILISSNDINSADPSSGFTVLQTVNSTALEWTLRSFEVPAGTKYFAIRHISNDVFGMMVDDIKYIGAAPVPIEPVSYNVYLNGVLQGSVDANDPLTYDFTNLSAGDYTVEISAVYPGGIESAKESDTFTIVGKTAAPTISVTPGDATYTITATAADPDATVTLTVDGVEYTGTGSVSVTVDRGTTDKNVDVSATAQKGDLLESDPATQIVTVPALPITPTPTITYDTTNATVVVTATGDGTVYLEVDGQVASGEGSVSITIMRSIEDRTVTATATAVDDNHLPSAEASREVPVPALNGTPSTVPEGLLRMHLLVVDQLKEEIPDDNSHPDRYGYVLKWEQPANADDRKQSGTVEVDIQKTEAQVNGYYTLDQIDADVNIGINHDQGLTMDVLTADVGMFLPGENPDVLYYQMQGKQGEDPELNEDYLTQLQYMKNVQKYEEMLATSPNKTHQYPANETYHYYDDSTPIVTGIYNDPTSFITYAPSVSTWGIQRRYFEEDGLDNTYGAPIWKTAVGKVELKSAVHERQKNSWNSVNWTDAGGNACSLYILKDIVAEGYLPHTGISNVEYEPYMFRVFVESKNGKLRPYTIVPQGDGDYDGEHLVAGEGTTTGPLCVWSGYCMDGDVNGMTFSEGPSETVSGQTKYTFTKEKVDRDDISNPWLDYDTIKDPETGEVIDIVLVNDRNAANAMFGALDNLAEIIGTDDQGKPIYATVTEDDLKVFVRFYYVAAGTADGHTRNTRAGGASYPAGYGTESPGKAPSPWTSVNELQYHGEIVGQTYYNVQGMQSDRPFEGVNIIVTRYSDGSTSVSKVVK